MTTFSRRQLIDRDYNPLEDPEGPDRADLEARYGQGERRVNLDRAADFSHGLASCWMAPGLSTKRSGLRYSIASGHVLQNSSMCHPRLLACCDRYFHAFSMSLNAALSGKCCL